MYVYEHSDKDTERTNEKPNTKLKQSMYESRFSSE